MTNDFALCPPPPIMDPVRAEPLDTTGSHFGSRPDQVFFRLLPARRDSRDWTLHILSGSRKPAGFSGAALFNHFLSVDPATGAPVVLACLRTRIDLSQLSLTIRSVVKQERLKR